MNVYAISPESIDDVDVCVVVALLDAGLSGYHLRLPNVSEQAVAAILERVPEESRERLVMHQHHDLVDQFGLGGFHYKDDDRVDSERARRQGTSNGKKTWSRSLHALEDLCDCVDGWDYVFLSPVFPSISKTAYRADWSEQELTRLIHSLHRARFSKVCALGGVDASNAVRAQELGFGGVVLHGALWRVDDPVRELEKIKEAIR